MKTIFLSAGHSAADPGAVGNGLKEASIAVEVRNLVDQALLRLGIAATLDARGQGNLPLKDAITQAKKFQIAIEFHCNASDKPAATGVETLSSPKNMAFGEALCTSIAKSLGIRSRGAKPEDSGQHHRLGFVQAGGIIVELFFISNPNDVQAYTKNKETMARGIANEIARIAKT